MNFKQLAQTIAVAATLLIAQPIHAETFYFHNDHLGTPQALTDDSGTVVWQGNYSPFGEVNETTDTVEQNIRFPGQYFEEETGLHYNYFRDYDPGTGRYIESDPIGLGGGVNTFGYVGSDPIDKTDPFGLIKVKPGKWHHFAESYSDVLDSSWCDWWPASCIFKCTRWRCERETPSDCGEKEVITIEFGAGDPGYSPQGYNADEDQRCTCIDRTINPR